MSCVLKKFILNQVNKLLDDYKDNVAKARDTIDVWLSRATKLVKCLESLSEKVSDSKLTDEELKEAVE